MNQTLANMDKYWNRWTNLDITIRTKVGQYVQKLDNMDKHWTIGTVFENHRKRRIQHCPFKHCEIGQNGQN